MRPMSQQFLLATNNQHKIEEVKAILPEINWETPKNFPELNDFSPEETGKNFAENAEIKARAFAAKTGLVTVAEDSGLEVKALNNRPGGYSARWREGSDDDRNQAILKLIEEKPDRTARYVATICVYDPKTDEAHFFKGMVVGQIAMESKGIAGFGYDPIFIPDGYQQTFGELGSEIKHQLSHRKKAFEQFAEWLNERS